MHNKPQCRLVYLGKTQGANPQDYAYIKDDNFMTTLRRPLLFFSLFLFFAPPLKAAYWSPHVGVDYEYVNIHPFDQYEAAFPKIKHGYNLYLGSRINGFFGFDIGYERTLQHRQNQTFAGGELLFVYPETTNDATAIDLRTHAIHFDFNFYWEVYKRFDVIFMLGAAFKHFNTHIMHLTNGTWLEFRNSTDPKWASRLGIGAQYSPIPCFGIKALVYGDQVRRINYVGYDQNNEFYSISPYKKSVVVALGIVYSFSHPRRHQYVPPAPEPFYFH